MVTDFALLLTIIDNTDSFHSVFQALTNVHDITILYYIASDAASLISTDNDEEISKSINNSFNADDSLYYFN